MSTIKDAIDLMTQLSKSVKDRKLATELLQIQSLISTVQSESVDLTSKNLELEKKIFDIEKEHEKEISELKKKLSAKELLNKYTFNKTYGVYESKEDGQYYCTSCLTSGIESPLQERQGGWRCKVKSCEQCYFPAQKTPTPDHPRYNFS
jgi:hypothetical protein